MSTFHFDSATHEYRIGDVVLPACTALLRAGGLAPYALIDAEVLERKSELGVEVHRACHLHNIKKFKRCDVRVTPYLESWIRFKEKMNFKPRLSEYRAVANLNGMPYGMTIDCAGEWNGQDTVIDYKIGEIYPHHGVQLAGYAIGLPHPRWTAALARFMSRKRLALQLRENDLPKIVPFEEVSDFHVFQSLLYLATWKKQFNSQYQEKT